MLKRIADRRTLDALRNLRNQLEALKGAIHDPPTEGEYAELRAIQSTVVDELAHAGVIHHPEPLEKLRAWRTVWKDLTERVPGLPGPDAIGEEKDGVHFTTPGGGGAWFHRSVAVVDALVDWLTIPPADGPIIPADEGTRGGWAPNVSGLLWFDEQGHLNQSGPVPLARYLAALSDQLRLFLARLDSCDRNHVGHYLLWDARAGTLSGPRVLWDNVTLLVQACISQTLPGMTPDQRAALQRDGVLVTTTIPTRNAQPLADALRQLLFLIPYNADGSWVREIPSTTVDKIRTIASELVEQRRHWETSHDDGPSIAASESPRTPQVAAALMCVRDSLADASRKGERLADSVEQLEARYVRVKDPNPAYFYVPTELDQTWGRTLDLDWVDHVPQREQRSRRDAIDATLALRAAVDSAIESVSGIASHLDGEGQAIDQRWSTRTIGHLRKLRGAIVRGHGADACPSALPMIRAGVPDALREYARQVMDRMEEVKSAIIAGVKVQTGTVSVSPDLLERLQRAAAAVDPGAIDRAAERAAAKVAREFGGNNGSAGRSAPPAASTEPPLTADHESILAVLGKTPKKCKTVIDVASGGTIRNRETVGRLLGELAGFGLVNRPHGKRKGYALTDEGLKRLPGATPT